MNALTCLHVTCAMLDAGTEHLRETGELTESLLSALMLASFGTPRVQNSVVMRKFAGVADTSPGYPDLKDRILPAGTTTFYNQRLHAASDRGASTASFAAYRVWPCVLFCELRAAPSFVSRRVLHQSPGGSAVGGRYCAAR